MNNIKHLFIAVALSWLVIFMGTTGYMIIEGWSMMDAMYMTMITISTVGFSEVHQVSLPGRVFTIALVLLGVGFSMYTAGAVVQLMVEGQIRTIMGRKRLDKKISRLKGHFIVCGYGRIGRVLCRHLLDQNTAGLVAIEKEPELAPVMEQDNMLYLSGDATDELLLRRAGIENAAALVAVLTSDAENVFLVLTARQLNPKLFIMARASGERSLPKLKAAGADCIESPHEMGAVSMAQRLLRPTVTSFLNFAISDRRTDIQMEEIPVAPFSPLANVTLKDSGIRQEFDLIIIAVSKPDGSMAFNPSFETIITPGETLIAVGQAHNLRRLEKKLNVKG